MLILSGVCAVIYLGVKWRMSLLQNPVVLEEMITTPNRNQQNVSSPCEGAISGDPSIGQNWVKLVFNCPEARQVSTLALPGIKHPSWKNIMTEYAKILGFEPVDLFENPRWKCQIPATDPVPIEWEELALARQSLECTWEKH